MNDEWEQTANNWDDSGFGRIVGEYLGSKGPLGK